MKQGAQPPSAGDFFYGAVTIGERGQVVIPAEARKQHDLEPGEKLLVFRHPHVRGVVLARLEDVQAIVAELRQLHDVMSRVGEDLAAKTKPRKRSKS